MSGVVVAIHRPRGLVHRGPVRRRPSRPGPPWGEIPGWVVAAVVVVLVLAGGGTAATAATESAKPAAPPVVACTAGGADELPVKLTTEQRGNAARIVAVGQAMAVPQRGQIVALATAMQESRLRNIDYGDRDSLGLFQQRPSQGWGSPAQVTDPVYASRKFYNWLISIPGWQTMPVTVAAQKVQRSAFPNAYAKWEALARALVTGTTCTTKTR